MWLFVKLTGCGVPFRWLERKQKWFDESLMYISVDRFICGGCMFDHRSYNHKNRKDVKEMAVSISYATYMAGQPG